MPNDAPKATTGSKIVAGLIAAAFCAILIIGFLQIAVVKTLSDLAHQMN